MTQQMQAVTLLRQAYRENLDLICGTSLLPGNPEYASQLYTGNFDTRALVCFTSWESGHSSFCTQQSQSRAELRPCRFVLGNMANKSVIKALVFDPQLHGHPAMLVMKDFFCAFNPDGDPNYPAPENFYDPGRNRKPVPVSMRIKKRKPVRKKRT